jgi:hypothetical protein
MITPDPASALKPKLSQDHQDNIKNGLYTKKTELQKLEDDLKYMTGKADKLEVEEKIKALKEEISNSPEAKIIDLENEKNYEMGMSFDDVQNTAIINLERQFVERGYARPTDIKSKFRADDFVKNHRLIRNDEKFIGGDWGDTDRAVLEYEKAFNIKSGPIITEEGVKIIEQKAYNRQRNEDIRFVGGKIDYLRRLEERLLEAKARAKTKILGGKDTTETLPIEKEISQIKSDIALGVTMAASTYLGLSIEKSDMGL